MSYEAAPASAYSDFRGFGAIENTSACRLADDKLAKPKKLPAKPWLWPVPGGYATSVYGMRFHPIRKRNIFHRGLDIGHATGTGAKIVAPADGTVTWRNDDPTKSAGRYIRVEHDDGFTSQYLHLLTAAVVKGERVKRGQVIAIMDSTGSSTAPHLHLDVEDPCGNRIDPMYMFAGSLARKVDGKMTVVKGKYGGVPWYVYAGGAAAIGFLLWPEVRRIA